MAKKPEDNNSQLDTTGHEWDGIQELNTPLPRWWLWTFYACIVWGLIYVVLYPAWPGLKTSSAGVLGWSTRGNVAAEIQAQEDRLAPMNAKLVSADLTAISADAELNSYALNAGGAVFKTWCAQCHGSGAAGAAGYPNLLDDDWLWGGSIEEIHYTVSHGIRSEEDDDTHYSEMPKFGVDELLSASEIDAVVNYVMSLSPATSPADEGLVADGAAIFADQCASCHMDDATGDRSQGAPNLTDAVWLYGSDFDTIRDSVHNARFGVMPPMGGAELTEAEIRAVATYVHQLGGGE